jgi:outer membrane protein OmpA-like peptidoglycan-associated protein
MLLILSIAVIPAVSGETGYRIFGDFKAAPVFYEFATGGMTTSFGGSVYFGQMDESYMNIGNAGNPYGFQGAENLMRFSGVFIYNPVEWFEMKNLLGLTWTASSFNYLQTGAISKHRLGPGIGSELLFKPKWKYFDIVIINRIDLLFHLPNAEIDYQSSDLFFPGYYGGVRFNFHPYLKWINLYTEIGVTPWIYTSYPIDISTAMISFQIGASVDFNYPKSIEDMKSQRIEYLNLKTQKETMIKTGAQPQKKTEVNIRIINNDLRIDKIKTADKGEVIAFSDILFEADTDQILESTYSILDQIASVLMERKNILVDVNGHTNSTGKPRDELILSQKRAERVVEYFITRGVDRSRLKARGFGGTALFENRIGESNRRVEIKIADIIKE